MKDLAHTSLNIIVALDRISMDNIRVSDISDRNLISWQISNVIFVVIGSAMTKREQGGCFSNSSGAESGPSAILGSHVKRCPQHSHISFNIIPAKASGLLRKCTMAYKR